MIETLNIYTRNVLIFSMSDNGSLITQEFSKYRQINLSGALLTSILLSTVLISFDDEFISHVSYRIPTLVHRAQCEIVASVVNDAVRARKDAQEGDGAPFTLAELTFLHQCVRNNDILWSAEQDILYLVMGSSLNLDRSLSVRTTWARKVNNVVIYGDVYDFSVGMITLPELVGKSSYNDAQHRQLKGLIHSLSLPENSRFPWVFLVDDDTWINTRELSNFLYGWNPDVPMLFGHIHKNAGWSYDKRTWPSGGAGMLLSRAAADLLVSTLYTPECPFDRLNDLTIGYCAWRVGIALSHSPLFNPTAEHFIRGPRSHCDDNNLKSEISVHSATPSLMIEIDALFESKVNNQSKCVKQQEHD